MGAQAQNWIETLEEYDLKGHVKSVIYNYSIGIEKEDSIIENYTDFNESKPQFIEFNLKGFLIKKEFKNNLEQIVKLKKAIENENHLISEVSLFTAEYDSLKLEEQKLYDYDENDSIIMEKWLFYNNPTIEETSFFTYNKSGDLIKKVSVNSSESKTNFYKTKKDNLGRIIEKIKTNNGVEKSKEAYTYYLASDKITSFKEYEKNNLFFERINEYNKEEQQTSKIDFIYQNNSIEFTKAEYHVFLNELTKRINVENGDTISVNHYQKDSLNNLIQVNKFQKNKLTEQICYQYDNEGRLLLKEKDILDDEIEIYEEYNYSDKKIEVEINYKNHRKDILKESYYFYFDDNENWIKKIKKTTFLNQKNFITITKREIKYYE